MPSLTAGASLPPAHVLSSEIGARRLSPVDLVDALLERIRTQDRKLHAFVEVYAEEARLAAEAADKAIRSGHVLGPLHGIPIALKDLIEIEGRVTTGGSEVWRDRAIAVHRHAGAAADRRRADRDRQDPHGRVRYGRLGHQPASRHAVESLGPQQRRAHPAGRAAARALPSRPARTLGDRHRYRRLGAVAGVVVRPQRAQDHDRAGQHLRDSAIEPDPRYARTDGALGRGRGTALPGHARAGPARPAHSRIMPSDPMPTCGAASGACGSPACPRPSATASTGRCSPPMTQRSTSWRGSAPRSSPSTCRAGLPTTPL